MVETLAGVLVAGLLSASPSPLPADAATPPPGQEQVSPQEAQATQPAPDLPAPAFLPPTPPQAMTPSEAALQAGQPRAEPDPAAEAELEPTRVAPEGQWVYTYQYGWVWMPYAQAYTYVTPGGYPYMYSYGTLVGWRWLYAPWVFGWGPSPYWGVHGHDRYAWHAHPWFHKPEYRGHVVRRGERPAQPPRPAKTPRPRGHR